MNHFRLGFQQFLTIDDEKTMARFFHTATLKIVGGGVKRGLHICHTADSSGFLIHHGDFTMSIYAVKIAQRCGVFFPLETFEPQPSPCFQLERCFARREEPIFLQYPHSAP